MYDTILVAIDGSPCGQRALDEAMALASAVHARLEVLHVVESGYESGFRDELVRQGQKLLALAKAKADELDVQCTTILDDAEDQLGDVSSAITRTSKRVGANLLVLGTHGRKGIDRLLMGSVAEKLARSAVTPVLLVRPDSGA